MEKGLMSFLRQIKREAEGRLSVIKDHMKPLELKQLQMIKDGTNEEADNDTT